MRNQIKTKDLKRDIKTQFTNPNINSMQIVDDLKLLCSGFKFLTKHYHQVLDDLSFQLRRKSLSDGMRRDIIDKEMHIARMITICNFAIPAFFLGIALYLITLLRALSVSNEQGT